MPRLRLGVIGAGSWAVASHLPNFAQRRDEVEFVAVSRKGPELLQKTAQEYLRPTNRTILTIVPAPAGTKSSQ